MIEFKEYTIKNKAKWNQDIIHQYFRVLYLSFITEIIIYVGYYPYHLHTGYVLRYVVTPTVLLALVLLLLKLLLKLIPSLEDYLILATGSIIITILSYINNTVTVLGIAYILPIMISIFYYEKQKVIVAFITNVTLFLVTNLYLFKQSSTFSLSNLMTSLVVMIISILIVKRMINEINSIMRHIRQELEAKQTLMAEKAILERSLRMDGLTNLYNHSTFQTELKNVITRSNLNNLSFGLAILDIDNFKQVNDIYGHRAGDQVIKQVATIIKETISDQDLASRYGGEEYAIIMMDYSLTQASDCLETIRRTVESLHLDETKNHTITVSIGYLQYSDSMSKTIFFNKTDDLLYKAKNTGKNKVIIG